MARKVIFKFEGNKRKKRKGKHSKCKSSKNKNSKNYLKLYNRQGR